MGSPKPKNSPWRLMVGGAAYPGLWRRACNAGKGWRNRYPVSPGFLHAELWEVCKPARFWES